MSGKTPNYWHLLGGNQSDGVRIVRKTKTSTLLGIRRAPWRTAQPPNVRVINLKAGGAPLSNKEA
jgi:hypothetical protein